MIIRSFIAFTTLVFLLFSNGSCAQDNNVNLLAQKKFETKLNRKNTVLLDVRTSNEYNAGHIANAVNYNVMDSLAFLQQVSVLDKNKTYLLYCRSGHRSGIALNKMKELGFRKVYHLKGGITDWTGEVVKPQ